MPKVVLGAPVKGLSGKFANSDVCYFISKNGQTYARSATGVANPRTESQVSMRAFLTTVTKSWKTLTAAQRDAWQAYADVYYTRDDAGDPVIPSGANTFLRANSIRLVLGQTIVADAPVDAPPAPLSAIAQVEFTNPDALTFTITHAISDVTGLQVIARMSPQMSSVARTPRTQDLRYCRGVSPDSALALTASGTDLSWSPTDFSIEAGGRYGVEARVVRTADGIMSNAVFGDFLKSV